LRFEKIENERIRETLVEAYFTFGKDFGGGPTTPLEYLDLGLR